MNTSRLVTWITFLAVFAMASRVSMDTDSWWHLRAGQWIVQNHAVPQTDPFSYTRAGELWQYPGWLVEVPMYLIYQMLGPGGLNLWTAAMVTLAFIFVWQTLSGGAFLRAFIVILAATTSAVYWAARPYLLTFLLAAVFIWILEDYRWNRCSLTERRLWWLPALMVVWVNSHGGFIVGFLLWGVYWFADLVNWLIQHISKDPEKKKHCLHSLLRLSLIGLLMVLAVCINPYGPVMLAYPLKTISIGALQDYIQEWQSPDFHVRSAQPFIWLLILTFAAIGISRRRLALIDFLLLGGFTYMSLLAWRNVALFALISPVVLTRHAAPVMAVLKNRLLITKYGLRFVSITVPNRRQLLLNWVLLSVLALAVIVKVSMDFSPSVNQRAFRETLPLDAVAFIKNQSPPGRLFNSYNWGGYLMWELPDYPVFIDGRTDLYDNEVIDQWLKVIRADEGWQEVLDRWNVRLVLVEPSMPVVGHLNHNGWELLYKDQRSVIYGR